ncbi:NADP-dependent phosphogluconate dehydrogenase, partial [[Clostridium] symbiosum]|nr:NADP-dependent phosphogluconate dehydrogenase [[Clostridium] symbiosum]
AAHLKYSSNEAPGLRTEEREKALLLSMILAYSQGFELISKAAEEENWNIDLAGLAAVWKDGCIIRSALLGMIEQAEELSGKPLIL